MAGFKRPGSLPNEARALNDALHDLHARAGRPSLTTMVSWIGAGVASRSRIHEAFISARVPDWGLLDVLVEQLADKVPAGPDSGDEVHRFHQLWLAATGHPATDSAHPGPSTLDVLLVIAEWVNAPLLPFPATQRIRQLVDAALTDSAADTLVVNRRDSADGSLLVLQGDGRSYPEVLARLMTAFDDLLASDRRANHYRRRPYPQLRLLAHAGQVEYDGTECSGALLLALHAQNESMTVRDALVGDDDVAVIVIASDQVFDADLLGDGNSARDWIPVTNVPDDTTPLKLWIGTPARRSADPATAGSSSRATWAGSMPAAPTSDQEKVCPS
ncbi:hypothetical protein O7632_09965 [Solwaraspora sp. WMMD406]|uniref:hypothetical protein n=1 Tax=Solwaraspora sp. WMMD406 TaxID=3016095 RepID=UPI002416F4AE|nr:hypothetical protein [Solwaraspora sp. WMMD406]MDG4764426.1 hypothetical protein [Solwaraspora sp. WMMD406]